MGWWTQNEEGESFGEGAGVWGDGPADILGEAVAAIEAEFVRVWDRSPTLQELEAGVKFTLGVYAPQKPAGGREAVQAPGMLNVLPDGQWPS